MLRRSWTDDEDEALKEALRQGVSVQRLAVRLKRPQGAIRRRAATLELEIKPLPRLPNSEVDPATRPRKRGDLGMPSKSENG